MSITGIYNFHTCSVLIGKEKETLHDIRLHALIAALLAGLQRQKLGKDAFSGIHALREERRKRERKREKKIDVHNAQVYGEQLLLKDDVIGMKPTRWPCAALIRCPADKGA